MSIDLSCNMRYVCVIPCQYLCLCFIVLQETRSSFVKMLAGKGGHAPTHEVRAPPPPPPPPPAPSAAAAAASVLACDDDDNDEEKSRHLNPSDVKPDATCERLRPVPPAPASVPPEGAAGLPSRPKSVRLCAVAGVGGGQLGEAASATVEVDTGVASAAAALNKPPLTGDVSGGVYSDNSCSVCLDEYVEGDQLLRLTCGHVFHRSCIDLWLKGHCVCPCCR